MYVMILSSPQPLIPRIEFSCALHTALGLMMVRSQSTTLPSASPVTRRSLCLMKAAACTWALWPRKIALGAGGESAISVFRAPHGLTQKNADFGVV